MGLTISYSHAVPYIREQLCREAERGENTRALLKNRRAAQSRALGLVRALQILADSEDAKKLMVPGIANEESLPAGAIEAVRRLPGLSHRRTVAALLGLTEE